MKLNAEGIPKGIDSPLMGVIRPAQHENSGKFVMEVVDGIHPDGKPSGEPIALLFPINEVQPFENLPSVHSCYGLEYLTEGDVVQLLPDGLVRVLYRKASDHNFLFSTEACNSFCLMCSQPPKKDDLRARIRELAQLIDLIDPATQYLGFTGGEPTLLSDGFLQIIQQCKNKLPDTQLHVLTNGRIFRDQQFTGALALIGHPKLTLGIPIYSDVESEHDYVVQARGAFEQTVSGLLNLAMHEITIELRFVIHRQTFFRLPQFAQFVSRNFPFVSHVALMGLEPTGFAIPNMERLWIDPLDYAGQLQDACDILRHNQMPFSIYNHQLCVIPQNLWKYAVKSISDWKNVFFPECTGCVQRGNCGGFFASADQTRSRGIHSLEDPNVISILAEKQGE